MSTNSKIFYPSKNVCIYCGNSKALLTDEHIVPFFIGGKHILSKASCLPCADITKKFEQDVGRGLWGDARASYNAPTRNKKDRVKAFSLKDPKGVGAEILISAEEYPAAMVFYRMPTAGIINCVSPTTNQSKTWVLQAIIDPDRVNEFEKKYPGRLTVKFKNVPESFGRMIAKIAYCQIMTVLDPTDFKHICLPYILGKKSNISYVVGGRNSNDPVNLEIGYSMNIFQMSAPEKTYLGVEMRLLANNDTPSYHVIVGEVTGKENMDRIDTKICGQSPVIKTIESYKLGDFPSSRS